jgi:hypothetical protein
MYRWRRVIVYVLVAALVVPVLIELVILAFG